MTDPLSACPTSPQRPRSDDVPKPIWLEFAEAEAGESGYAEHALRRLAASEERYCCRWTHLDLAVEKLSEGAADLGSWGVLALRTLEHEEELNTAQRELLATTLHAAILWGACVHKAAAIAQDQLGHRIK